MTLNDNDYREIAAKIEVGINSIEYEKDGKMLCIDCKYDTDCFQEDGYENGTGAWVETSRSLVIFKAEAYDEDGKKTPIYVDETRLMRLVA